MSTITGKYINFYKPLLVHFNKIIDNMFKSNIKISYFVKNREILYSFYVNNYDEQFLLKYLLHYIIKKNYPLKFEIIDLITQSEYIQSKSNKKIIHIEKILINICLLYQKHINNIENIDILNKVIIETEKKNKEPINNKINNFIKIIEDKNIVKEI